ncbi:hypothetical protein D3C71_1333620 [compost metagenome]
MLLEFGKLPVKKFNGFFGLGGFTLNVLANVLSADFVERAPQAVAVAVFERNTDHVRLLALFSQLETPLKVFDGGEQRCTRDQEFGTGFAVESRYHQGDGTFGSLSVEYLAYSAGQWFGKIGMAQRVLITG